MIKRNENCFQIYQLLLVILSDIRHIMIILVVLSLIKCGGP